MRIGLRLGRKLSGGMASFVRNLGSAIDAIDGHSVVYLCIGEKSSDLIGEQVAFGAKRRVDEYRLDFRKLGEWCDDNAIDALVCPGNQVANTGGKTLWWPLTVAPFEELALNMVSEGPLGRLRWQGVRRSLALSARSSDKVVFSSNYARALYGASLGEAISRKPTIVLRPTTSIDIVPREVEQPPYLLTVSNFNRYKFVEEMLNGFSKSQNLLDGWKFKLAGRFPVKDYEESVRSLVADLGIEGSVEFLGEMEPSDFPSLYSGAAGFVFASVSENAASYTVIDALAYGIPTASSYYSSTPEILGNSVSYFDPFSPDSVADSLRELATDSEAKRLSSAALKRSERFPTWDKIAQSLIDFATSGA